MDYLKVFLVLAPQLIAGCLIYLLLLKRDEVDAIELLSVGSVLGIVSSTIVDQIFVNLQMPRIGWLVALLAAVAVFLLIKRSQKIYIPIVKLGPDFRKSIFPIAAISTMALGNGWYWLFPSGVLFTIASFFSITAPKKYTAFVVRVASFGAVIAGVYMISNRPKIWSILNDSDNLLFHAFSSSIANHGVNSYVLLSDEPIRYHWFIYAWIGLIDRITNSQTLFVLNQVAPSVFVFLTTSFIWSWINKNSTSKTRTFVSVLVVMNASSYAMWVGAPTISILSFGSPSQLFGNLFLFITIFLVLQAHKASYKYAHILCATMACVTVLTKTMHGIILFASIFVLLIFELVTKKNAAREVALIYLASLGSIFMGYSLFISSSATKESSAIRPGEFIWTLLGDGRNLSNQVVNLIGLLFVVGTAAPAIALAFLSINTKSAEKTKTLTANFAAIVSGVFFSFVTLGEYGENLYFLHAAAGVSLLLGFVLFAGYTERLTLTNSKIVFYLSTGVLLCWLTYQIPDLNSGAMWPIIYRYSRIFAIPLLILAITLCVFVFNFFYSKKEIRILFSLVAVFLSMCMTFTFKNWYDSYSDRYDEFNRIGLSYIGSFEVIEIGNWINKNTDQNSIVASNFGWPKIDISNFESYRAPCTARLNKEIATETCNRTRDFKLVAYTDRIFWLQSTQNHYTGFTPEMDSRQTATLGFASDPTAAQAQQMLDDGVDWFVVDRSTTDRTSWEPFATTEYTNDSFFALRLNKSN